MTSLPVGRRERDEGGVYAVVKLRSRPFDAVVCTPSGGACKARVRREIEEQRQVGNETARRQRVGASHFLLRQPASRDLVRVRREEEPVQQNKLSSTQCRPDDVRDELRA